MRQTLTLTGEEKIYKLYHGFGDIKVEKYLTVSEAFLKKLKKSCFGHFIQNFNEKMQQDQFYNDTKMNIDKYELLQATDSELVRWKEEQSLSKNLFLLLEKAVKNESCITMSYLYKNLTDMVLVNSQIVFCNDITKFSALKNLILPANFLKTVFSENLPRSLQCLELFSNEVNDVQDLCNENGPTAILHLGLGRNPLNDSSNLHLLAGSGRFETLLELDLSYSALQRLLVVLNDIAGLKHLRALSLEGSPCYLCESYKDCVLYTFPELTCLDGSKVIDVNTDEEYNIVDQSSRATLQFMCFKLNGLPDPPKGKDNHQFYIEISMPELEALLPVSIPEPVEERQEPNVDDKSKKKGKKGKEEKKKAPKSAKSSKKGGKNIKGPYGAPDEHEIEIKSGVINMNFKTEPLKWAKAMKFPSPALVLEVSQDNFTELRNTLQSRVRIKIVYMQTAASAKGKKDKKPKKKKSKEEIKNDKDKILKKITFATFYCDLRMINWNEQCIEYVWTNLPENKNMAIPMETILQEKEKQARIENEQKLNKKEDKKGGKKKDKKEKSKKGSKKGNKKGKKGSEPISCHFGFGLLRSDIAIYNKNISVYTL